MEAIISALFEALIMFIVEVLLRAVNFCTKKLGNGIIIALHG